MGDYDLEFGYKSSLGGVQVSCIAIGTELNGRNGNSGKQDDE